MLSRIALSHFNHSMSPFSSSAVTFVHSCGCWSDVRHTK